MVLEGVLNELLKQLEEEPCILEMGTLKDDLLDPMRRKAKPKAKSVNEADKARGSGC